MTRRGALAAGGQQEGAASLSGSRCRPSASTKAMGKFRKEGNGIYEITSVCSERVQFLEEWDSCDFKTEVVYILPLNSPSAVLGLGNVWLKQQARSEM